MSIGVLFWLIIILGVIFGVLDWKGPPDNHRWGYATWVIILVLFGILGYSQYGFPFHR